MTQVRCFMKEILIIFVKNPIPGKVKSRLASSIGVAGALSVYKKLLSKTKQTVLKLEIPRRICYSDFIDYNDQWPNHIFQKRLQEGQDLGARMHHAIQEAWQEDCGKICLIGSDIYELSAEIIHDAFELLDNADVVIGPSVDGGYYLIGMKIPIKEVLENKNWGTSSVLQETIDELKKMGKTYALLTPLNDIDELEDIKDEDRDYLLS